MRKVVLIKISGESLKDNKSAINFTRINSLIKQIKKIHSKCNIGIVVGGGNIIRGANINNELINRTTADNMGMLATIINSLALKDAINKQNIPVEIYSLIPMPTIAKIYNIYSVNNDIKQNKVIIFSGGTGNPYFSTDTGIALRALEIKADTILMGKNGVNGIYSSDPNKNRDAKRYDSISYDEIISKKIKIIDMEAIYLFKQSSAKIIVFDTNSPNCYVNALNNKMTCTIIK